MATIRFETGQTVQFDGTPTAADVEEVATKLGIKKTPEAPKRSFLGGVAEDFQKRNQNVAQSRSLVESGKQSLPEGLLQSSGQVAGLAGDILGEGLGAIGRGLSRVTPDFIEKPIVGAVQQGVKSIFQGPVGQGVNKVGEAYQGFKEQNPRLARNVEAVGNIASILPIGKAGALAGKGGTALAEKTGQGLVESGLKKQAVTKTAFLQELVRPERTKAVKEAEVARTTETGVGPFKSSVVAPSYSEKQAITALQDVPGVKPRYTYQRNYNVISNFNTQEAERLKNTIARNDFIIPKTEVIAKLNQAKNTLASSPTIVGDAEKTAQKLIDGAIKFVNDNPGKGSGLLQARKDYDAWVLSQKPKAFDATAENAFSLANREVRSTLNEILDTNAPNAGVKQSLRKQSALYDAMENIEHKAASEADTAFGRKLQRIGEILGTKSKIVQGIAAAVGIGGLGAASTFAPIVAPLGIGGWLMYKSGKLVLKPQVRIALGEALKTLKPLAGGLIGTVGAGSTADIRGLMQEIQTSLEDYD